MAGTAGNDLARDLSRLGITDSGADESDTSGLTAALQAYTQSLEAQRAEIASEREREKEQLSLPQKLFNKEKVPKSIIQQCKQLPIYARKEELLDLVLNNQFVIVLGETGSGKSTQIPQYLAEAGFGKIGVTQPRRIAAKSLADRVAFECGVKVGGQVGYAVRFDNQVSPETVIKYMTDGMLVRECTSEASLDTYSVIIIDEAHERSIHTDICFGLLKRAARRRPDLRVIISSATLQQEKFSDYFKLDDGRKAPILTVTGKSYDVEVFYNNVSEQDFMEKAVGRVIDINRSEPRGSKGDILVFLSGQDEIEQMWDLLEQRTMARSLYNDLMIMPIYGALPMEEQQKIYEEADTGYRKVVLATNVAETSLTIDGIVYVIDCGYFKETEYNPRSGVNSLIRKRITKFQAIQRKGRAGRTQPGKCYRMYSEFEFGLMPESSKPEITRCNLESVILSLIAMGIANPRTFEFMDKPNDAAVFEALIHLSELGALGSNTELTTMGRRMSEFPLDPSLARVVIESEKLGCSDKVVKIVGIISTNYKNLFYKNKKDKQRGDQARRYFADPGGDLISLLKVYDAWVRVGNKGESWCRNNAVQYRLLLEADEIQAQLKEILTSRGVARGLQVHRFDRYASGVGEENIRRAFTAGYFRQLAKKKPTGHAYTTIGNHQDPQEAYVHPTSCTFSSKHPFVIYQEVTKTKKTYMSGITPIDAGWIKEYAPIFAAKISGYIDSS